MTTINTIEDLIRLLDENPEWREALRDRLLIRELIELPEKFAAFVDDMITFKTETNERFDRIERRLDRIQDDVGTIRGVYTRDSAIRDASQIADDMGLTWVRSLPQDELARMSNAPEASALTRDERRSFRRADLVIEALDSWGEACYVAVEISFTVNGRDTSRAADHARILTALTGRAAHPAVAGMRRDDRVSDILDSGEIFWFELPPLEVEVE